MCGIAGIFHRRGKPAQQAALAPMVSAIAHRGPDGDGHYNAGPVALGHRRLSIIDLSQASSQPFHSADGRYHLTYNGELYNYRSLRNELQAKGIHFQTDGDTEVLLQSMIHWGEAALLKFNGMFAFGLWDSVEQTLLLARDRFGVKPLYWSELADGTFLFGSEVKAIQAYPGFRSSLDSKGLVEYLTFQNIFTDRTLYHGVQLMPQGSVFKVSKDRVTGPTAYWDFNFQEPENPPSDTELLEELDFLFRQAVSRQLVSDVDIGSYLSGGVDSGSITALAAAELPYMKTFTVGFDMSSASGVELAFDERTKAERMSYLFKTEHYEAVLKAGDMERSLPLIVKHQEEPRVGQCYPNWYATKLASKFVKVVLSGAGGDELFGGYPWRYYRAAAKADFAAYADTYYDFWQRLVPNESFDALIKPLGESAKVDTREIFRGVFDGVRTKGRLRAEDCLNLSLHFEAKTFLNGLLIMEDKLSMAHSLETRVPFLDNDLADFAMRLPAHLKVKNLKEVVRMDENKPAKGETYFAKTKDGKLALREVMTRYVPDEIANAVKQGFSAPDASWFKGESIDFVRRKLLGPEPEIAEIIDVDVMHDLVEDHLSGTKNRRLLIWSLLYLNEWIESEALETLA